MLQAGKKYDNSGRWVDYNGSGLFIRGTVGNYDWQRAKIRNEKPYKRKIDNGTIDPKAHEKLTFTSIAEGLWIDWRDVLGEDGTPIAYSVEGAVQFMVDDPELAMWIINQATDDDSYRIAREEEIVKKSPRRQAGTKPTAVN